jgi:hypothetical protein
MHSVGDMLPGEWTSSRDLANHKTTAYWHGKSEETYPWGKETDYESLTYIAHDDHPEITSTQGEAKTVFELKAASSPGRDTCPSPPTRRISITSTRANWIKTARPSKRKPGRKPYRETTSRIFAEEQNDHRHRRTQRRRKNHLVSRSLSRRVRRSSARKP